MSAHPDAVLCASMLRVGLGQRAWIEQASLTLSPGQWLCACGPNGAGKSTLLRALAGLTPYSGQIELAQRPLRDWSAAQRATRLTWMGQAQAVPLDLTVADVVRLGPWPQMQSSLQSGLQSGRSGRSGAATRQLAEREAIESMRLEDLLGRGMHQLSGGECQRALLARAMAANTPVMLFDEPLNHLDMPIQHAWLAWLRRRTGAGAAVLTVMHDLNQALAADQLLVMQAGRVLHQGAPGEQATREALQMAFDHALSFHAIDTQGTAARWVVLPHSKS